MAVRGRQILVRVLLVTTLLYLVSTTHAHPLGNNSITHFNVLWILPDHLEVDLLLDLAEMPSTAIREEQIDADKDNFITEDEQKAWLEKKVVELETLLEATINGQIINLKSVDDAYDPNTGQKTTSGKMMFMMPGFAGMPTYKILIRFVGKYPQDLPAEQHTIYYHDKTYPDGVGLKRIILQQTEGIEVFDPHPDFYDPDQDPMIYEIYDPSNLPEERSATIRFRVTETPTTTMPQATAPSTTAPSERNYFDSFLSNDPSRMNKYFRQADKLFTLLQSQWGFMMIIMVTAFSFGYGAVHALMPGHAKTVVAAYLISQHGTYKHAILLAVVVTITHTALVVALGVIVWACQETNPSLGARMQLWLGALAGLLVAAMGAVLIWRAVTGRLAPKHHHRTHQHQNNPSPSWFRKLFTHSHPQITDHSHEHPHTHHHHPENKPLTTRMILVLGITGGIVPCPTATIIMLLGIGANMILGALYAVGIFSLGMALTLMLIGILALSSRRYASKILSDAQHQDELSTRGKNIMLQIVPAISGTVVLALGAAITANYLYRINTGLPLFAWLG